MYYISYYTRDDDERINSPAANAKILSISKAMAENDEKIEIICSLSFSKKLGYIKERKFKIQKNINCFQFGFFRTKIKKINSLMNYINSIRLVLYLIIKAKKNEYVLFYNCIERIFPILIAKKIKKFKLLLEVEEIYTNASKLTKHQSDLEYKIINEADAFIFSTKLLNSINKNNKPFVIINGTYNNEIVYNNPNNNKIHIVYAGTFDELKGGVYNTIESGLYLDNNYCIHILGFGNDSEIKKVKDKINDVAKKTDCQIKYEGCKTGLKYIKFLQSCHIGLSTQNPNGNYNDTSFPSKVLTYMANGLRVISIRIPVVETSKVGKYLYYYNNNNPNELAEVIKSININEDYDSRKILNKLNKQFIKDIGDLIKDNGN